MADGLERRPLRLKAARVELYKCVQNKTNNGDRHTRQYRKNGQGR